MKPTEFVLKGLRECYTRLFGFPVDRAIDNSRVELFDQKANDYLYDRINAACQKEEGLALCKFGSIELANIVAKLKDGRWNFHDYINLIKGYPVPMFRYKEMERLHINAGFFPQTEKMNDRFVELMLTQIPEVDILASYVYCERYVSDLLKGCKKVNLDGYYAPFRFENPWSRVLKGKKVLVVHPFVNSIACQYNNRAMIHKNPDVLPEFESLHLIKAVQSIAGNECGYADWFEALDSMKKQMSETDFDIALIGCGAYGFPLATHAKSLGKIGIHLAGWTQMLFGIYGKRWIEDQPEYSKYINDFWIRPEQGEVPQGSNLVEGGCYW